MSKEKIQTGEPLDLAEMIMITGKDAAHTIGGHKVRIMNFTAGQLMEVDDIVEQDGYLWGIKKLKEPRPRYDSIAFIAVR